jgi:copper(I)-binding protein
MVFALRAVRCPLAILRAMNTRALFPGLAALVPFAAFALTSSPLNVTQPWARATAPGVTVGVVYFEIVNAGPADTLLSVESPVADHAEMHDSSMKDGAMKMRPVKEVKVPANGHVRFASGGLHVMLVDLKQPLVAGQRFPLKLNFKVLGTINQEVVVKGINATS